jgi:hypothetical protein
MWRVLAFCDAATLDQLIDVEIKLKEGIADEALKGTNAPQQLKIVENAISRKRLEQLFGDD